jgi:hypothetical protein
MSFKDRSAQSSETLRDGRTFQIGTRNPIAEIQQYLGYTAHADAADADEMYLLNLGKHG